MKQYEKTVKVLCIKSEIVEVLNQSTGVLERVKFATIVFAEGTLPYIKGGSFEVGEKKTYRDRANFIQSALTTAIPALNIVDDLTIGEISKRVGVNIKDGVPSYGTITFNVTEYEKGDMLKKGPAKHHVYNYSIIAATMNDSASAADPTKQAVTF